MSEYYVILNDYIVRYYCSFYCISLHDVMDYWIMHYYNLTFYYIVVYFTCIVLILYVIYVIDYMSYSRKVLNGVLYSYLPITNLNGTKPVAPDSPVIRSCFFLWRIMQFVCLVMIIHFFLHLQYGPFMDIFWSP